MVELTIIMTTNMRISDWLITPKHEVNDSGLKKWFGENSTTIQSTVINTIIIH